MEVIEFEECNADFGGGQLEYTPISGHLTDDGTATFCWQLTEEEKLKVMETGHIFLSVLTFNHPLQPLRMSVVKPNLQDPEPEKDADNG